MGLFLHANEGPDLGAIEACLLRLSDVLDAHAYQVGDELAATVTLAEHSSLTGRSIQRTCMEELGLHQTPRQVKIARARLEAA